MACGLPAIVSDECGCVPDLIIQGKTGYSYPCGDISALSKHMMMLADNPEKARSLGSAAFKHIQNYSVENAGNIIIDAISRIRKKEWKKEWNKSN
jgi:glycosyltransferase involved in cell wall biosynthesis